MKPVLFFTALLCTIITSSCKKKTLLILFTHYDINVTIPAPGVNIPPGIVINPPVIIPVESEVKNTDSRINLIENAKLQSSYITITSPVGKTFAWCEEIHVALIAE